METDTWREYSKYVLLTIEKLARDIEETNKEHQKCKDKTLESLSSLKILLLEKIQNAGESAKKDIEPVIKRIEGLIKNVTKDVSTVSNNFLDLKENVIIPLRIKVAVISIIGGATGGFLITLLIHFFFRGV